MWYAKKNQYQKKLKIDKFSKCENIYQISWHFFSITINQTVTRLRLLRHCTCHVVDHHWFSLTQNVRFTPLILSWMIWLKHLLWSIDYKNAHNKIKSQMVNSLKNDLKIFDTWFHASLRKFQWNIVEWLAILRQHLI